MELTEENTRLKNSIKLLESEIDTKNKEIVRKNKSDSHQKSEIKRLTNVNDSLRRELYQYKRQEKPPASITNADEENSVRQNKPSALLSDIQGINDKLEHLRRQVGSLESTVQSAINVNETPFINVRHRQHRPSQQSRSNSVSRDNVATYAAALDSRMPTVPAHDDRTSSAKPQIAVIGTSLVRGLGPRLTKRGFEVSCFVYAGCEIPMLCDRIKDILSAKHQPDVVILQCAGNDLENGRPPSQVIQQMDHLIHEIKRHCPRADKMLNHIPPRGENSELLDKISMVNTFIHNISRDKRSRVLSCDVCPTMFRHYQRDGVHFNHAGKQLYASAMAKTLSNFLQVKFRKQR